VVEHGVDACVDVGLQLLVLRFQVNERNAHRDRSSGLVQRWPRPSFLVVRGRS
jgi:hypothetical protein